MFIVTVTPCINMDDVYDSGADAEYGRARLYCCVEKLDDALYDRICGDGDLTECDILTAHKIEKSYEFSSPHGEWL